MSSYDSDDDLQQALADALAEQQETPASFARVGRELFVWRTVDAELAELVADSAEGAGAGVLVRGGEELRRSLSFRTTAWVVEVDVERDPDALRGQLSAVSDAPLPPEVLVERPDGAPTRARVDELGYFSVEPFVPGSTPFRLRLADVVTAWVS